MLYSEASYRRRLSIEDELLAMLQEVPFDRITVLDIAQRQNIARKTFYSYFPNKQACLEGLLDRAIYECSIRIMQESRGNQSERQQYAGWLRFWKERQDLLGAIIRNRLENLLVERLTAYTNQEDFFVLDQLDTELLPCDEDILHFYLSGLVAMLLKWGTEGFSRPMEEMVEKLCRLMHQPLFSYGKRK